MYDISSFNAHVADCPTINGGAKRSEIVATKILCSQGDFAVAELASGKFAVAWKGHVDVVDDKAALAEILNQHENTLLSLSVVQ